MKFERAAGILLHPTSLPGRFGIGDLGQSAYIFADFLEHAGQKLWQVFPLGPTGYGDSPYQCFSAFAGNPLLISPEELYKDQLLSEIEIMDVPRFDPHAIDYGAVINYKFSLYKTAFERFRGEEGKHLQKDFHAFCKENSAWLEDYSLFMASKDYHGGELWTMWNEDIALCKKSKLKEWREKLSDGIEYYKFLQFTFYRQWMALKSYVNKKGIKIIGDLPIFIAYDSADLWANKSLFTVDKHGKLLTVAGVPPDYFSPTGQLWGNPHYRWDEMAKDDYKWWRDRISSLLHLVDIIRIDHFRGFEAYWEIPGDAPTAQTGKWVKAPGMDLFAKIEKYLGKLPIIAEDLGVITPEVEELRDTYEFPGMKILQFAFGSGGEKKFLPHNFINNCCVYTGSHDNDTTRGFFDKAKHDGTDVYNFAREYLNYHGDDIVGALIKAAYASVADTVVIPMQDILRLGTEARMNFPGKLGGNWGWRYTEDKLTAKLADSLKHLAHLYERPVPPKK